MHRRKQRSRQNDFFDTCSHCKTNWSCCHETTPPVTERRMKLIESFLKENHIEIQSPFVKTDYMFPRLNKDGYCIFHGTEARKCIIHPVKPETCVAGPITFDINRETEKIEWFIKMKEICPLAGRVFEDKVLLMSHVESAKREIKRLVNELDSDALAAILRKDEPETFKINAKPSRTKQ